MQILAAIFVISYGEWWLHTLKTPLFTAVRALVNCITHGEEFLVYQGLRTVQWQGVWLGSQSSPPVGCPAHHKQLAGFVSLLCCSQRQGGGDSLSWGQKVCRTCALQEADSLPALLLFAYILFIILCRKSRCAYARECGFLHTSDLRTL